MKLLLSVAAVGAAVLAQTPEDCSALYRHGQLQKAEGCYQGLTRSPNPLFRAEGLWALGDRKTANDAFRDAQRARPDDPYVRVRWGRMYLDNNQPGDAAQLFQEALKLKADYAPALLGMALAGSENFEKKAVELAEAALKSDPKLVEAHELLAR